MERPICNDGGKIVKDFLNRDIINYESQVNYVKKNGTETTGSGVILQIRHCIMIKVKGKSRVIELTPLFCKIQSTEIKEEVILGQGGYV
jgi:hypothetical protein